MSVNGLLNNMVKCLKRLFYMQQSPYLSYSGITKWDVNEIISEQQRSQVKYAVLILNRPIIHAQEFMRSFWNSASIRITVDGGTNQWDRFLNSLPQDFDDMKLPDLVTGDFDSVTQDLLDKYRQKGCKIVHTPDQNYTDFTKALMELDLMCQQQNLELDNIIAIGQCSGRIDQILGNIQTLFLAKEKHLTPTSKLFFISDDSISWLLAPGHHEIAIPESTMKHKRAWCSLIPVGGSCDLVTSTGLKWNLDNQPLKFGELVSTSNAFNGSDTVQINCSHTLLWSMRVPCLVGS